MSFLRVRICTCFVAFFPLSGGSFNLFFLQLGGSPNSYFVFLRLRVSSNLFSIF